MTIKEALDVVLELAEDNALNPYDYDLHDPLYLQAEMQSTALGMVFNHMHSL